jgi:hypothetical protein
MDDGYVGAGLAWMAQKNKRNWERFNGETCQLGDNKEVYDAKLFGIAMAIRHAAQRFGQTPRGLRFLQTHKLHSVVSKMTRRVQDTLRERSIGES